MDQRAEPLIAAKHKHPGVVDPITAVPNALWTADLKGQFRAQDRISEYGLPRAIRTDTARTNACTAP